MRSRDSPPPSRRLVIGTTAQADWLHTAGEAFLKTQTTHTKGKTMTTATERLVEEIVGRVNSLDATCRLVFEKSKWGYSLYDNETGEETLGDLAEILTEARMIEQAVNA